MAANNSTFSTSEYARDIFLSFRGQDTRKIFIVDLYNALRSAGFGTFIDDHGIERGEDIKSELIWAINHSRGSIIVMSENYANSGWCLDELVLILENRKSKGHVILPIFYYVTPTQVGKQMDSFEEAFAEHEDRVLGEKNEEKRVELIKRIERWRTALTEVAEVGGIILRRQDDDGHARGSIPKIVQVIEDKLNRAVLTGAPSLIGIQSRVEHINQWLKDASTDASILVITGVGGIGKTTIAKVAYNLNFVRFQASSFLENVREISEKSDGLLTLQSELLSDLLNQETRRISSVEEGTFRIKYAIHGKKILLVLDDVDRKEQLDAILGMKEWFYPGSKIIITTRQEYLFKSHEIYKSHKVEPLNNKESLELFSWHAFGQDHPVEAYRDLSLRVLDRCKGLPLALKVLGSSLSGKSIDVWKSALEKLEEIPEHRILKLLQISYDSLPDEHDRNLFLHIACFFIGKDKIYVIKILDECDFHTMVGIQNLIDRCLLTIDTVNMLRMHQLIQDMGRDIVRRECPRKPGMRSRLWRNKDSFNVLKNQTGTPAVKGLLLDMGSFLNNRPDTLEFGLHGGKHYHYLIKGKEPLANESSSVKHPSAVFGCYASSSLHESNASVLQTEAFALMSELRLLQLKYVHLTGSYKMFPKHLRWLCWHGFPLQSIPNDIPLESVVALDMSKSQLVRLWKPNKVAHCMKILDLSHCHGLIKTPNFSGLPNLEELILKDCIRLSEVHESIGNARGLVILDLEDCKSLSKLPKTIARLKNLRRLDISGCANLTEFPVEMEKLTSLRAFYASGIGKSRWLSGAGSVNSWQAHLWLWMSKTSKNLVTPWASLPQSLVYLSLRDCNIATDVFPRDFSKLISLKEIDLSGNPLRSLPEGIRSLNRLERLIMISCVELQSLEGLPDIKKLMINGCRSLETITHVSTSSKLQKIDFSNCDNLNKIQGFFSLEPMQRQSPTMLKYLGFDELECMQNVKINIQDGITFLTRKIPIQLLYEFGIFSMSLPGRNVPCWYCNRSAGSSISFTVPSIPDLQTWGLNICFSYALSNTRCLKSWFPEHQLFVKVTNTTKNLLWIYFPTCFGLPEADQELLWLSHWMFKDQLESSDNVELSIVAGDGLLIMECGINFLHHGVEEDMENTHSSWKEVIGGDLSAFQLSKGVFYLCRNHILLRAKVRRESFLEDWTMTTSWGKSLFGGSVDFKEICYMNWTGRAS